MLEKLPIIGPALAGRNEDKLVERIVDEIRVINAQEKLKVSELDNVIGGVLDNRLSDEKQVSTKLLKANKEWVYKNNDVIAKEVSQIDFALYQIGLKDGKINYTEVDSNPILDLLDRFNDATTSSDGLYLTQSHKKLTGDSFWLLDKNGNTINNLYLLQPDKVTIDLGTPTDATDKLIKGYEYKDSVDGKVVNQYYPAEDVIHFKTPNPNNPYRGYGAVEAAADTIDIDNLTNETTREFFRNGAITNFVLSTEGKLTDEQLKRLKAELNSAYGGVRNAYKTMILSGGLKPEKLSYSNKEMEFLSQLEWYRDKLMVVFGNTKASLGLIDDVNRASFDSSIISWKRISVKPEMKAIVDTLNEFMLPFYGTNYILGFKDPIPEDRNAKLTEVEKTKGILSVNERRALLGYDAIQGGDTISEIEGQRRADEAASNIGNGDKADEKALEAYVPSALQNVNRTVVLRRQKWFEQLQVNKDVKEKAIPLARKIIADRKKKKTAITKSEHNEHNQFTDKKVWAYWQKQINVVEQIESRFKNKVVQFLEKVEREVLANVDTEIESRTKQANKALYQEEELLVQAGIDFTPLLMDQVIVAGQQANDFMGLDSPYLPLQIRATVSRNVQKFTKSMLKTDREKLISIIAGGIEAGESVGDIKSHISAKFTDIKKTQSELITRTEVIKASNMGALDAFEQSGIVEGKQWLTAKDERVCRQCGPMNGKTIGLRKDFFKKGESFEGLTFDYESIHTPPLHPNCRCVLLPVLRGEKGYIPASIVESTVLKERIKELEATIDKRTKDFKELKEQQLDDKAYIKALEGYVGGENER